MFSSHRHLQNDQALAPKSQPHTAADLPRFGNDLGSMIHWTYEAAMAQLPPGGKLVFAFIRLGTFTPGLVYIDDKKLFEACQYGIHSGQLQNVYFYAVNGDFKAPEC